MLYVQFQNKEFAIENDLIIYMYLPCTMSVASVIEEIQRMSDDDREKVIKYVSVLTAKRQLSGSELTSIASYMVEAKDPIETMIAREAIMRGFYGQDSSA